MNKTEALKYIRKNILRMTRRKLADVLNISPKTVEAYDLLQRKIPDYYVSFFAGSVGLDKSFFDRETLKEEDLFCLKVVVGETDYSIRKKIENHLENMNISELSIIELLISAKKIEWQICYASNKEEAK